MRKTDPETKEQTGEQAPPTEGGGGSGNAGNQNQSAKESNAIQSKDKEPTAAANNVAGASNTKKNPSPTPYRYCMPTHALYTAPAPTARTIFFFFFLY